METLLGSLDKLAVPISIFTALFAGSAWLSNLHNKVDNLTDSMKSIEVIRDASEKRDSEQDSRLARIEGKLDIVINHLSNWGIREKKSITPRASAH